MKLSSSEFAALELLISKGGAVLASTVPDKNEKQIIAGTFYTVPGHGIYKKLEKKGLVFYTEEDPMDDGFVFTNEIYTTDEGREAVKNHEWGSIK
jgi:hypothetical protein